MRDKYNSEHVRQSAHFRQSLHYVLNEFISRGECIGNGGVSADLGCPCADHGNQIVQHLLGVRRLLARLLVAFGVGLADGRRQSRAWLLLDFGVHPQPCLEREIHSVPKAQCLPICVVQSRAVLFRTKAHLNSKGCVTWTEGRHRRMNTCTRTRTCA